MARKRLDPESKGLPSRWAYKHGAYYYRVPAGQESAWDNKKWFPLGKALSEAYREFASRVEIKKNVRSISELLERYSLEVVPGKAKASQKKNLVEIVKINLTFGDTQINSIVPMDIYKYIDERDSKSSGKREMMLLSHAFTKAVEWGYINKHPFKGEIRIQGSPSRTRYVEDWEIVECLSLESERKKGSVLAIQAYIRLKLLTGLRMSDLLRIKIVDCKEDGIHVFTNKTGKAVIYQWSDELRKTVELVKDTRPVDISPYLFCNKLGQCYVNADGEPSGWKSMWQRFMARVLTETKVTERFTEHDLRAKVASDATTLEHAQKLLAHADSKTTNRVYRRKAEIVSPAR